MAVVEEEGFIWNIGRARKTQMKRLCMINSLREGEGGGGVR